MNHKKLFLVLFISVVSMLFTSCKKDEVDTSSSNNYLKVGNIEYELSEGHIGNEGLDYGNGSNYEGYETVLSLYTYDISQLSQNSVFISIEMYTDTGTKLDNGEYKYNVEKPYPIRSFSGGDYEECINFEDCNEADIAAGDITVSLSGNVYTITIDCEDENGTKITGFYKGTLAYLDYQGL